VAKAFRFAPSPNGFLHLGHARSALLNQDLARESGGRFLLRIEDIDQGRARPLFETAIYEDLAWLGLDWEQPVRRQSEHFADYAAALEQLDAMGLLYACDCKRSDIAAVAAATPGWPRDPDGAPVYPGFCRAKPRRPARDVLRAGGVALRLDMEKAAAMFAVRTHPSPRHGRACPGHPRHDEQRGPVFDLADIPSRASAPAGVDGRDKPGHDGLVGACFTEHGRGVICADPRLWGDVVLARKDTPASYHIAVVVDDALQGVTDVVRGQDLFAATSLHRLLQDLLGLPEPRYRHHPLITDAQGEKLAKSRGSPSLRDLRAAGVAPDEVRRMAVGRV